MADRSGRTNWAGNYTYGAKEVLRPATIAEAQEIIARTPRIRVLGTRHSFNSIADTPHVQLSTERLNRMVALDPARRTVTVEAGVRYGELCRQLHTAGWALHNLASLPHISVAGAVTTATHGSGDALGNLATAVVAMDLITASGEIVARSRAEQPEEFPGMVVALGALGLVARLTLAIEPAYAVRQVVYDELPFACFEREEAAIFASADSVSLFTDWRGGAFHQFWQKHRVRPERPEVAPAAALFGARRADAPRHPIPGHAAENCTAQLNEEGAWHERLPHFRLEFTPSSGAELQSEYFVPRRQAIAAWRALQALRTEIAPLVFVSELRTIAEDDLWLSPCFRECCLAFHFTWRPEWAPVRALLPRIEAALAPFEARPHWGKLFTFAPREVAARYARMNDFRALMVRCDPAGKFRNEFVDAYVLEGG